MLGIVDRAGIPPDERQILTNKIEIEHQRIISHRHLLPVAHEIGRRLVWHLLDAIDGELLGKNDVR